MRSRGGCAFGSAATRQDEAQDVKSSPHRDPLRFQPAPARLIPKSGSAPESSLPDAAPPAVQTVRASDAQLEASADQLYLSGQFGQALAAYQELLRSRPQDAHLHFKLASAAWNAEQPNLAEQHLLAALQINPAHAAARERLALLYIGLDQIDLALEHIEIARASVPVNQDFALTHVNALERAQRWQEAWAILEPLLEKNPVHPHAANLFTRLASKVGRQEQAAALVDRVLKRPDVPAFERHRLAFAGSKLAESMGRYDQAFALARLGNELAARPHAPMITQARV